MIPKVNIKTAIFIFVMFIGFHVPAQNLKPPNVIFILTDQWRASAFGYSGNNIVQTPHLDKFSQSAVNFKNAVSVLPVCTPYRASLMTGRYPTSTGMFINDLYLPSAELCMAEIYNKAGYNTAYLGKWHLDGHGRKAYVAPERRQGWMFWEGSECDHNYIKEHYYENNDTVAKYWEGYSPNAIAKEAQRFMEGHVNDKKPFFLFISIATPHFPHNTAPQEYKELYSLDKLKLPPNVPEGQYAGALKELQGYYAHCTATDKAIGVIIDKTRSLGIYGSSVIVFTSDHGEMMGAHGIRPCMKHTAYTESSNVPFLIRYPGIGKRAGEVAESAITTPDILPSLLSLCNIEIPGCIEGYDLSGIIRSPEIKTGRAALYMNICPFGSMYYSEEYRAVRTSSYTYVKSPGGPSMLFDNNKDPYQMDNLVNKPEYTGIQKELETMLKQELLRIGETSVNPRDYYLKKFGYWGKEEFRDNYHIKNPNNVEVVISPISKK